MKMLTFNEIHLTSAGSFSEIGAYVGTALWTKTAFTYIASGLITTGCLPVISPYAAAAGLVIYIGAGTAVGGATDKALNIVSDAAYSLFYKE